MVDVSELDSIVLSSEIEEYISDYLIEVAETYIELFIETNMVNVNAEEVGTYWQQLNKQITLTVNQEKDAYKLRVYVPQQFYSLMQALGYEISNDVAVALGQYMALHLDKIKCHRRIHLTGGSIGLEHEVMNMNYEIKIQYLESNEREIINKIPIYHFPQPSHSKLPSNFFIGH